MTATSETPSAKRRKPRKPREARGRKASKGNGAPKDTGHDAATPVETLAANGQKLVKVDRKASKPKTIDDVVSKHVSEASAGDISDDATNQGKASTGDTGDDDHPRDDASAGDTSDDAHRSRKYPDISEVAAGHGAVPPMEADPAKREVPTMGPVGWTEDTPDLRDVDAKPACLEDLMAIFPVGTDPQYYVQVYRRAPKNWGGNNCAGMMRPIRESMDTEEFKWAYGGGDYILTVYGPPKRGGQLDPRTNRVRPKALTGKVQFTIPYGSAFGVPPNPDAAFEEEEEVDEAVMEETMFRSPRGYSRPVTTADASIHKATLEADQIRWAEERREKRELAERLREADEAKWRLQQAQAGVVSESTLRMMEMLEDGRKERDAIQREREREEIERRKEAEERYQRAMEEQRRQEREEFKRMQEKPSGAAELAGAMKPLLETLAPKGDEGELKALRAELKMEREARSAEKDRIHEQHKNELERERQMRDEIKKLADERIREAQETSTRRLTEMRDECNRRIKEVEDRAERDVSRAKEDGRTRADDIKQVYEGRLKDEEKNHRRELDALKAQMETRLVTDKTVYEGREKMLLTDTERARADVSRLEAELRDKGDIVKQVGKITEVAEKLGMEKAGGSEAPADWKQILATAGLNVLQNLPETFRAAGEAVSGARNRGQPGPGYAPPQMVQQAPMQQLPAMSFGTEEEEYAGEEVWAPEPEYPPVAAREPEPVSQQMAPPPVAQPVAPYGAPAAPPPQSGPSQPPPKRRALKPRPEPVQEQPEMEIPDELILGYKASFEAAFKQKTPPEAFAQALEQEYGKQLVSQIATILTPERVMKSLMSTPEGQRSPLVRGEGQTYLRRVLEAIRKAGA